MAASEETLTNAGQALTNSGQALTGGVQATDEADGGERQGASVNVGQTERWASAIGGGALALYGITRGSLGGIALALVGAALVQRGFSGHCNMYEAMGFSTADDASLRNSENVSVPAGRGIKLEKSVTINRPPEELYRFWRNFENLPRFMNHLESVTETGAGRSHWTAKAPAGSTVEWDAEIYNEKEGEMIAWRTLEGADVASAGSVHFEPAAGGRGTVVRVVLKYDPPGGKLGALVARLFGENPEQQITEDLGRFKQLMETGEVATTEGQPSARGASGGR
ncbi:MAG: SRPBCC family protein [Acidobacteriota bacterium]|nr:SRPBCC family protein [Acidobacteriota bacterium]MDQ5837358.1 SRPBCC family protein [Acidobacteriota bacterium]